MAAVAKCNSKRMYSWWWDSHNTPKNSKWLQENLADMDSNLKQMIKVLEEDADSFARRAEMYYRKRPELMKLVEEFYRAYRALAERYNHATAVIQEAHQTMAEAFPNQAPFIFSDESHDSDSINDVYLQTPEMHPPLRARVDPDELHTGALGVSSSHVHAVKRNRALSEEPPFVSNGKSSKHMVGSEIGKVRKGLKFDDGDGNGRNDSSNGNHDLKAQILSESERASKAEAEVVALRDALSKMQAEKEASLAQVEKNLERLKILESEISCAQEKSGELKDRATSAEAEIQTLKETLKTLESEKEVSLLQYQQCLQKIADLEDGISVSNRDALEKSERASRAEAETLTLKQSLDKAEIDKEAALFQHRQCLETISYLEKKLQKAEEDARLINEQAEKARIEVENLKQTISKLIEDKETSELKYRQYLDIIADLKLKLFHAQEETQRLGREIEDGVARLKFSEEKCVVLERANQNLHSELDGLLGKLGIQSQELTEKQTEVVRLWSCVQEEHLRFQEAETAFQTLQKLHSQSQEELNNLTVELQTRSQIMKDMEIRSKGLHEEVQQAKVENKSLNEINLSSAASIRSLQDGVSSLKETIQKLEEEVELRVNQRNALQQEIYCLKEELSQIGKKHQSIVEQVELVGLHPNCFRSSVQELQEENSKLKEFNQREKNEKMALLEKLEIMETLVQKNLMLENSISELNSEVEAIRGKLKRMEETCQSLSDDKSGLIGENEVLISQLQTATENSEILSVKNKLLENSLFNADAELKDLRINLKRLEDSCRLLNDAKSSLTSEREIVLSHMDLMRKGLDDLGKEHSLLKSQVAELLSEREFSLQKIKELGMSLVANDREQDSIVQSYEARMNSMEEMVHLLQDENQIRERKYQVELDLGFDAQIEIFVLQKCLQDLLEKNYSLTAENQNIKEGSILLEKLVSELDRKDIGKQVQINSLINCITVLRAGIHEVFMRLEIIPDIKVGGENSQDQKNILDILSRLGKMQNILLEIQDENQQTAIENIVLVELLRQFKSEAIGIAAEKKILEGKARKIGDNLMDKETENSLLKKELREAVLRIVFVQNEKSEISKELEEIKVEKEKLNQELRKERHEAELWESQAATFFCDMQTSSIHETLIEALTHELAEACKKLESRNASKDVDIKQLKGRVNSLEDANKGKYAQAIVLLNASIQSLEEHVAVHCKPRDNLTKITDLKDNAKSYALRDDRFTELEDMRLRITAIAEAVMEKEKVVMLENSNAYSMLEAALKQIKELKTGAGRRSTRKQEGESGKLRKQQSHESETITKDIVLDQTSDGSTYEIINKKDTLELDDLSFDLKPLKIHKATTTKDSVDAVKAKGKSLSEESLVVDKLEIFDTSMDPNREVSKRKLLERLDSDLQKLDNLQITIDDLKSKLGTDEKDKKGDEYETIRGQLDEAEEAIEKLLNVNRKLTTKARSSPRSGTGNSPINLDETESNRRRRTSEQARRGSEKIGRLQLEIQRIQFVLMKLEGERENRARLKISDTNSKVLLRDYLYGVSRSVSMKKTRKKRPAFCGCVQPPPSP